MPDKINQKISQFIDDELPYEEAVQLLKEVKQQPELDAKMRRYEMASSILRSHQPVSINSDFVSKVSQALEQEVVYFLPNTRKRSKYVSSALAVAAGVAGVAILVANNVPKLEKTAQEPYVVSASNASQIEFNKTRKPVKMAVRKSGSIDPRFYSYLQAHRGNLYTLDAGVQNYASLAGYER
jgi:negative regulator of sigma E activity